LTGNTIERIQKLDQKIFICHFEQATFWTLLKVHEIPHAYDLGYLVLSRMPLNWNLGYMINESKIFDKVKFV